MIRVIIIRDSTTYEKKLKGIQKALTIYRVVLPWEEKAGTSRPMRPVFPKILRSRWSLVGLAVLIVAAAVIGLWMSLRVPRVRTGEITSVAVLPFVNLMNDPEQEYFVDGMHDALLTELSKLEGLTVISRQSVMRYKGSDKPLGDIARELQAHALIEGTVMRAADEVRINVQLIEAASDKHLWADIFDRRLEDVLTLHSDVAKAIAGEVKITLTPEDEVRLAGGRQVNPETYELYIKGMFHIHKGTHEDYETGLAYLSRAVEIDPNEPLAYAGLAMAYSLIGHDEDPSAFEKSREAGEKALELDDSLAEVHESFAEIAIYQEWDIVGAKTKFEKVISLNPNLAIAHAHYSWLLLIFERYDEALAEAKRAVELDPYNPLYSTYVGWQRLWIGQYEGSLEWINKALELDPDFSWGLYALGRLHAVEGRFEEAVLAHVKTAEVNPALKWALGHTYAMAGQEDKARNIAREVAIEPTALEKWGLAMIYTALGDHDEAFRWLEGAFEARWSWMPFLQTTAYFRSLHGDPRFQELLDRIRDSKITGSV